MLFTYLVGKTNRQEENCTVERLDIAKDITVFVDHDLTYEHTVHLRTKRNCVLIDTVVTTLNGYVIDRQLSTETTNRQMVDSMLLLDAFLMNNFR